MNVFYMAEIVLFPVDYPLQGFFLCDGSLQETFKYPALFAAIGTNFGGDSFQTFALPNLPAPAVGMSYQIRYEGYFPRNY